jgi:plastocyanin
MRVAVPVALLGTCAAMLLAVVTAAAAAPEQQIVIKDFMFGPASLTVKTGTRVTWVNRDDEPHTIASATGLYRSGALDTGGEFHFTFEQPGTYHYMCTIHPQMLGTIIVEP